MLKQLLSNPIRTKNQFSAGGDNIPIQTRASGQSVAGYQTQGLAKSFTTLGAYRMGDSDGNAAPSAIYAGDIFSPLPFRERQYKDVTFESVGNRVAQPPGNNEASLHALLNRLGEQKFKAAESAPFEDYFATQRLAREADEASRNAGLESLGQTREIMRNIVDLRRRQNEEDYLRRMLDSGLSAEDAQDEIDNVRRANALQEARKVEDRTYQAKLLISRIAASRGLTSRVTEPLTQSAAIENPTQTEEYSSLIGKPGEGFGSAPLDSGRQFMTPDFYKRFLRRSALTQGVADEMTAMSQLASEGAQIGSITELGARERQLALERAKESLAQRFESIRKIRLMLPLPDVLFGENVIDGLYELNGKQVGEKARFTREDVQEMSSLKLILAINQIINIDPEKVRRLRDYLQDKRFYEPATARGEQRPAKNIRDILRNAAINLIDEDTIMIPFAGSVRTISGDDMARVLEMFSQKNSNEIRGLERIAGAYSRELDVLFSDPGQGLSAEEFLRPVSTSVRPVRATGDSTAVAELFVDGGSSSAAAGGGAEEVVVEERRQYTAKPPSSAKAAAWKAWAEANGIAYTTIAAMKAIPTGE